LLARTLGLAWSDTPASKARKRTRGEIETLPSGSLRVRICAGIDPVSKKRHDLTETIPPGPRAAAEAEKVRARFLSEVAERRNPRTRATVSQLIRPARGDREAAIQCGALGPGDLLPTETSLAERYGVAASTAHRAIAELTSAGMAVASRGKRARVADATPVAPS
jgi:hypothetical protein